MDNQAAADKKLEAERQGRGDKGLKNLPVRKYLDVTVVPLLLKGMSDLVKNRPEDPVTYLAQYLLAHKDEVQNDGNY
eukprot:CAMPEP_0202500388 /NCGR_PEP_ID=MMETSP1361-20130828/32972_1 /ASSEMBLY_ACC=CAM_ASM_000849 /TAXON_ID=210615 /ORGANISM="Staurosira complex sp., Strain CCMP2646" /LENGTH=76 /DNA_ID=CAMNT_0049132829 /DNA_START=63 /DNA_END=293 /DNA_ORIENTATION=+